MLLFIIYIIYYIYYAVYYIYSVTANPQNQIFSGIPNRGIPKMNI